MFDRCAQISPPNPSAVVSDDLSVPKTHLISEFPSSLQVRSVRLDVRLRRRV